MQSRTARTAPEALAPVISLDERRARRLPAHHRTLAVAAVALWFGTAAVALATVLGGLVLLAYAHPLIGLPSLLGVATLTSVPAARRWIDRRRAPAA